MKLRDAARCGKATEAFILRIEAAREKLNAREAVVLKALESLPAVNESLGEAFGKWSEGLLQVDEDSELGGPPSEAPRFDEESLVQAIEEAFESARGELLSELGDYEAIVQAAADYEEPKEDESEDADGEGWEVTCDHPGCKSEIGGPSQAQAEAAGRQAGWKIGEPDLCPKHRT